MHACLPATLNRLFACNAEPMLAADEVQSTTATGSETHRQCGMNAALPAAAICILQSLSWVRR
jgi:hypothetical protein